MDECIIKYHALEDPLGTPSTERISLARRAPSLKGETLLLLDNGKLKLGQTTIFTDLLKQRLKEEGIKQLHEERLAPEEYSDLELLAAKTIQQISSGPKFDAVILGLGDSGSYSVRLVTLALRLEAMGIPTVGIYTEPLAPTAALMASASCPELPLVTLMHPTWSASEEEVRKAAEKALPEIIHALTLLEGEGNERLAAKRYLWRREPPLFSREKSCEGQRDESNRFTLELDPGEALYEIYERFCEAKLCDGLPIIPPTPWRVEAMLSYTDRDPDHVVVDKVIPSMAPITIRKLATNAVMAGCKPEYFPIIVTAFEAMGEPEYNLGHGNTTFGMVGPAVIVSGPMAQEIGMNAGKGLLSPGCRANSTIGRAIFLALNNICGSVPGHTDNSGIGSPVKYSYCFAEQRHNNPWRPLNEEFFDPKTTAVTAVRMYAPRNVMDHASETAADLMATFAQVAGPLDRPVNQPIANHPRSCVVILSPDHVRILAREGWSKDDMRYYLFEHARNRLSSDRHKSISARSGLPRDWPKWMYHAYDDRVPAIRSPQEIIIVVAGELGPYSAVCFPWPPSRPVTKPVTLRDGTRAESIKQFRAR